MSNKKMVYIHFSCDLCIMGMIVLVILGFQ